MTSLISLSSQEEWPMLQLYLVSICFIWWPMEILYKCCPLILFDIYRMLHCYYPKTSTVFDQIQDCSINLSHTWIVISVILQAEFAFSIGKHFATATHHNFGHLHQFVDIYTKVKQSRNYKSWNDVCKQIVYSHAFIKFLMGID